MSTPQLSTIEEEPANVLVEASTANDDVSLKAVLQVLYDSDKYNDVIFVVANKEVSAIEAIVKARSSVLKQKIEAAEENGRIALDDQNVEHFKAFIKFLYVNEIEFCALNVIALFLLGKKYNVQILCKKALEAFDNLLTKANASSFAATTFRDPNLLEFFQKCLNLVPDVMDTMSFFYVDNLKQVTFVVDSSVILHILQQPRDDDAEEALFQKVFEWANLQCKTQKHVANATNIKEVMKDLIPYIRFGNLTCKTLATVVRPNDLLTSEDLLSCFCKIAIEQTM